MSPKSLSAVAAAVLFNVGLATPADAQVKAALTRDVDRASAQPVNGVCSAITASSGGIKCSLYTVPAGKRLVVESVGYQAVTASGSVMYELAFGQDAGLPFVSVYSPNVFPLTPVFAFERAGARVYSGTQGLKVYLDESQALVAGDSHGGTANYQQVFSFSGYLVDK